MSAQAIRIDQAKRDRLGAVSLLVSLLIDELSACAPADPDRRPHVRTSARPPADTWYDDRTCWGCSKGCKASKFRPYGCNIGAEVRAGYAARTRAQSDLPYHAGFAPGTRHAQVDGERATSVSAMWSDLCQRCGEWMRSGGRAVERSSGRAVVMEECPF
jgi:hypothetical protein